MKDNKKAKPYIAFFTWLYNNYHGEIENGKIKFKVELGEVKFTVTALQTAHVNKIMEKARECIGEATFD